MANKTFITTYDENDLDRITFNYNPWLDEEQTIPNPMSKEQFGANLTKGLLQAIVNNHEVDIEMDQQPGYATIILSGAPGE